MFDTEIEQKQRFWKALTFLTLLVLLVFGLNNYLLGNGLLMVAEFVLAFLAIGNYFGYFIHKDLNLGIEGLFLVVTFGLVLMYFTGGLGHKTGVYWYYVFPVATLFLLDRFKAFAHILFLATITLAILYFSELGLYEIPYSSLETRQLLLSYLVVAFLVDMYKKRIDVVQKQLQTKNEELIRNVEERDNQYYETEKNILALKQNKVAMLNLLEDSRELENQLKVEKESVQRKVEERTKELNQERQKLFSFLSSIPEGVLVINKFVEPIFANKTAEKIIGKLAKDIIGKKLVETMKVYKMGTNEFYPEEMAPSVLSLAGNQSTVSDIEIEREGNRIPLRITGAPVYGMNREIEYGIVVFDDITEEIVLNRSKDEFFSIASHELRTPLTAIRGNSAMIKEMYVEKVDDRDFEDMITDIYDGSVRLIGLVNEFLDLGRLEQGKIVFKKEKVNIFDLCADVIESMQAMVEEKGGKVELLNACDRVEVMVDKDRLRMVLTNLIGNSLKFTEVGNIVVSTEKAVSGNLVVKVRDSGSGISLANQNLLFRKFQQAGSSLYTRDTSKGTGLGLYVSSLMLSGMGGKIWLEASEINKGSTFAFSVPLYTDNI